MFFSGMQDFSVLKLGKSQGKIKNGIVDQPVTPKNQPAPAIAGDFRKLSQQWRKDLEDVRAHISLEFPLRLKMVMQCLYLMQGWKEDFEFSK